MVQKRMDALCKCFIGAREAVRQCRINLSLQVDTPAPFVSRECLALWFPSNGTGSIQVPRPHTPNVDFNRPKRCHRPSVSAPMSSCLGSMSPYGGPTAGLPVRIQRLVFDQERDSEDDGGQEDTVSMQCSPKTIQSFV